MACAPHKASDRPTTVGHYVAALPDRGDGIACALRETYRNATEDIPSDMAVLLTAIDAPVRISDPG